MMFSWVHYDLLPNESHGMSMMFRRDLITSKALKEYVTFKQTLLEESPEEERKQKRIKK